MATATKYFTYQPKPVAAAPLGKGSLANQPMTPTNTLSLKPGQTAAFKAGKGWYAVDPPTVYQPTNPGWGNAATVAKPPPAAPPPPGGGGASAPPPAWDPNAAIAADWETISANADANEMTSEARANLQRQLRQAYIDYGGAGENLGEWAGYIDAPTIEAARNNKFSALAMNRANAEKQSAQSQAELAARGMLSSGDTVNTLKDILFSREGSDYGALRNFNSAGYGGLKELAQINQQAKDRIRAAQGNAAGRAAEAAPTVDVTTAPGGGAATAPPSTPAGKYTWDKTVTNLTQLNAWLKARGKTLASFKASNPAAYAKLAAQ